MDPKLNELHPSRVAEFDIDKILRKLGIEPMSGGAPTEEGGLASRASFPNQLPERLSGELAEAVRVGAKPIRFGGPAFNKAVNKGTIKYVVAESGEVIITPYMVKGVEISHAVLSNGQNVLAAGQAEIAATGGRFFGINITNHSGHFLSTVESLQVAREAFAKLGIAFP